LTQHSMLQAREARREERLAKRTSTEDAAGAKVPKGEGLKGEGPKGEGPKGAERGGGLFRREGLRNIRVPGGIGGLVKVIG
jgi:hypothetical protein